MGLGRSAPGLSRGFPLSRNTMKRKFAAVVLGLVAPFMMSNVFAGGTGNPSEVSAAIGAFSVVLPVAVASGVALVAGSTAVEASKWSTKSLAALSSWVVTRVERVGEASQVLLKGKDTPQDLQLTMPTKTVTLHGVKPGQVVVIERKTTEAFLLKNVGGAPIAVVTDNAGARQHSEPRGPR